MRTWVALLYSIVLNDGQRVVMSDLRDVAALAMRRAPRAPRGHPYGDGNAAERVLNALGAIVE